MITRRTLIRGTAGTLAGTLAGTMIPRSAKGATVERFQELPTARDERLRTLITTAVDAARAAGAKYADARLTFTQDFAINGGAWDALRIGGIPMRRESMIFGVRAQFDGYWGFASSPIWTTDEAARLGRGAVASAKANVLGKRRDGELAPNPDATSGDWSMPVVDDPFEMDTNEIYDYLSGLQNFIDRRPGHPRKMEWGATNKIGARGEFVRQQKAFGSSEGQFVTQRVYQTGGGVSFEVLGGPGSEGAKAMGLIDRITMAGAGFENIRHGLTREWAMQLYEELAEELHLPIVPVDVGRYPTLIHPLAMAELCKGSLGAATEIDRVMGYEANATGTSYIVDPDEALGSLKIGAPLMHVTGTRSSPGGLAHVKWDDEGVEPKDFALVQSGILTGLQTDREGTAWMRNYLTKTREPFRSHGCAYSPDASDPPLVRTADLRLHPDPVRDTTLEELRTQMEKGVEFKSGKVSIDFQQSTGLVTGFAFKIEKGKRVARIVGPGILFRTPELWGNLQALGGAGSVVRIGTKHLKGEPMQLAYSSVDTPPVLFKEMSIINPTQKA